MIQEIDTCEDLHREPGTKELPYVSRWLAAILFPLHAVFMRRYFRIEVSGEGNIPESGPFILAPTHRSRWDAFMLVLRCSSAIALFHDEPR